MTGRFRQAVVAAAVILSASSAARADDPALATLERQFRELPVESRRLTGPLFWLHGDETKERLELCLDKVAESGNGCFTAESRPHRDWLGEGWYRDLDICLQAAKKHNLKMWIFDEKWWPSQGLGGKVPPRYAAKCLAAGRRYTASPVEADPLQGTVSVPADIDLGAARICLELDELAPEAAASVTVNGKFAGGFIGKPFRLDVTRHLRPGVNSITVAPFAPKKARIAVYPF